MIVNKAASGRVAAGKQHMGLACCTEAHTDAGPLQVHDVLGMHLNRVTVTEAPAPGHPPVRKAYEASCAGRRPRYRPAYLFISCERNFL